ncbi:MAG: 23S rRNA (adenine(2503)-C(2))-methyltransferase RlmN [Gemmatimonadota bacterium]|nr:MAG: 23S rRNA (adenine(2503)-C(2))-methyltransferase RlmN [Gemmatimonadota bacterium]
MNLLDRTPAEAASAVERWLADRGEPTYRSRQILPRLWQRPVVTWRDATDLPQTLRAALDEEHPLPRPAMAARQVSTDGTVKFLWDFPEGGAVESVLIPEGTRRTLCISSQAGCAYGCTFCATGRMGFIRHLATWEIVAQVREMAFDPDIGLPSNVVFMGMGEPLHNWDAVDRALTVLNDPQGMGIGARHITVSTVSLIPKLEKLAARPEQFRVALSLHAPTGARRQLLMPVERKYPLKDVLEVLQRFPRRVTFEYVMIRGVNDRPQDAAELARHARALGAMVNLLPLHPGGAPGMEATAPADIERFAQLLRDRGVNATVRRSRGLDISAACGQLRTQVDQGNGIVSQKDAGIEE